MNKIKIIFNSHLSEKIGSVRIPQISIKSAFEKFNEFDVYKNIYNRYEQFDVAILHGDEDEILKAREQNPNIIIGVAKPHHERVVHPLFHRFDMKSFLYQIRMFRNDDNSEFMRKRNEKLKAANFVIADSIHLKHLFELQGINSIYIKLLERYSPVSIKNNLQNDNEIIFGYHGNSMHFIESMPYIFPALNSLSKEFSVTLKVVSNINSLKKLPKTNFNIELFEYSYPEIYSILSDIDIGLVPNQIGYRNVFFETILTKFGGYFWKTDRAYDLLFRYKQSVNAGRAFVFSQLRKPFIGCPIPELLSTFGSDMEDYFPYSKETWEYSILKLSKDKSEQLRIIDFLNKKVDDELTIDIEALKLKNLILSYFGGHK
ncbi:MULTISPECIES: hypothetical protein [unclassified Providencia]|uniref:hypothetical protein n=1 Tax=unclassified Providencia TaxID=2633465 RepID=UPI00234A5964|nr:MULTISPECIES: hypothetical protein [unclassified Providencia]